MSRFRSPQSPSADAEASPTEALWQRYRAKGDPEARAKLLERHLGLVHHIARQIGERVADRVERDDLISAGTVGLVLALESFDASRGLAFSTYATPRIRGAILDELRERDWVPRSVRSKSRRVASAVSALQVHLGRSPEPAEIAHALDIDVGTYYRWRGDIEGAVLLPLEGTLVPGMPESATLQETLADPDALEPDAEMAKRDQVTRLRDAIAGLPPKQRTVLALYYYEDLNLRQIAEVLHLTESRVSQIRTEALRRLRQGIGRVEAI